MGTEISDDMHGTVADYPGEDPSELEHKTAMENLERLLRGKDLLGFTLATPVKTAEYADYAALPMPLSATDTVTHAITVKNAEIASKNANRDTLWKEHVSKQADKIAVLLEERMLTNAPYTMRLMKAAHTRTDGSARVDGGAWYRALLAKKGTLSKEETEKQCNLRLDCLKQNPLPANARGGDFANRVLELNEEILPSIKLKYEGENSGHRRLRRRG